MAADARRHHVRRLVLAHLGRPTLRALDAVRRLPFGEAGRDGDRYVASGAIGWRRVSRR
ncbi:MAG: hypothetical protein ACRD0G_00975 [Acidimicrobiales bacterium]